MGEKRHSDNFRLGIRQAINALIPAALQNSVKWGDSDAPPEGWHISVTRTKPGVEGIQLPCPGGYGNLLLQKNVETRLRNSGISAGCPRRPTVSVTTNLPNTG